jgi:hypothetical protein
VPEVPLPPGTALVITPLPDGTFAAQVPPTGVLIKPEPAGGYRVVPAELPAEPQTLDEKLRGYLQKGMSGLQSQMDDVVRFGQALIGGVIKGVFTFFLVLMIGAFILIDMEKVHGFLRSLFPPNVRDDYDVIIAGIDRGLSGVIRGQLLICLINGILTYIGLLIFDVKYSLILAFVAAMMSLIPIFGSILSTIPIVLAALVSGKAGIDVVPRRRDGRVDRRHPLHRGQLPQPQDHRHRRQDPPGAGDLLADPRREASYGLVGALLAVPVLSIISVVFMFFYKRSWRDGRPPTGAVPTIAAPPAPPAAT